MIDGKYTVADRKLTPQESAAREKEIEQAAKFHGERIEARRLANCPWETK